MNKTRRLLFRLGTLIILLAIAGCMMVVGRGHTVYLDNKTLEYNGQSYPALYKIEIEKDGEKVAKLSKRERGKATNIGQNFEITLHITREKKGAEETQVIQLKLPYSMDGIILNLPGYLEGLPEEAYLSEFISTAETEPVEEETPAEDEFGISSTEEEAPPAN